jgi:protoheme IX farnesyltransferase
MSSPALTARRSAAADFLELTKPRITFLVTLTALVGFVLASPLGGVDLGRLLAALVGTALVASGSATLNMLLERHVDARMRRTGERPLPAGRLRAVEALAFGAVLTVGGVALLAQRCGWLPAAVAFVTWAAYLFAYTPLKTRTSFSTIVGAIPGALPPVIGWTASGRGLEPGAFVLFAILFLWQIPHFLAIAWLYREDYARGGLPMLPVVDPSGRMTGRQAVANSLALLLVSLTPTVAGLTGIVYLSGAALLGLALTAVAVRAAQRRTLPAARQLFLASVLYLPLLSTLLLLDRT